MDPNFYGGIGLTGGGVGALDKLDGVILNDKDGAVVITESSIYAYHLDADSGVAESSPQVISPDSNPGNKRWLLKSGVFAGLTSYGNKAEIQVPGGGGAGGADAIEIVATGTDGTVGEGTKINFTDGINILGQIRCLAESAGNYGLAIGTWNGSFSEKVRINAAGFVSAGVIVPFSPVHLGHATNAMLSIQRLSTGIGDTAGIRFKVSDDLTDEFYNAGIFFERTNVPGNAQGSLHICLDADSGGNVVYTDAKVTILTNGNVGVGAVPVTKFTVEGIITLKERAAAAAFIATYGQIWCKSTAPCELWFTDDGGSGVRIAPQDLRVSASPTFVSPNATGNYFVDGIQVVTNRVIDARIDDAIDSGDATTDGVIDALRDMAITHGLVAPA